MAKIMMTRSGARIVGTLEVVEGTALFSRDLRREDLRSGDLPYGGETDMDWGSQETKRDSRGQRLFVSEAGEIVAERDLIEGED